ncbi:WASH complex subunit 3-like, partial [Mizuhopecten yessoensis]|uniref:WASH complex subunit 3-like n=1 Tax=Mizuhopecten yessoensis TaxID=6573 RepID=UPI000B45985E
VVYTYCVTLPFKPCTWLPAVTMKRLKPTPVFDSKTANIKYTNEKPALPVKKETPDINTGTNFLDILNSPASQAEVTKSDQLRRETTQPKTLSPPSLLSASAPPLPPTSPLPPPPSFAPPPPPRFEPPSHPASLVEKQEERKTDVFTELDIQPQFMMGSRDDETMESDISTTDDRHPLAESSPQERRRGGGHRPDFTLKGSVRFPVQPENRVSSIYD